MAGRRLNWPSEEDLLARAAEHTTYESLAKTLGVSASALSKYLTQTEPHLKEKVDAVLSKGPALEGDVSEVEVLRQRVAELERGKRAHRKIDVLEERVLQTFHDAIEGRKPSYSPRVIPKSKQSSSAHEMVLLWSDTHAGEVVSEVETNGINSYDWKTMMRRHDKLRESLFSFADNRPYPVSKLHVFALGDMLSGAIHDELVETNEMPLAEATIQFAIDGSLWLESLLERFPSIQFSGVVGNHPRSKRKPQAKQSFDNADWLAYHAMKGYLRNQSAIEWDIPKASAHPVMVGSRRCLLWHGDGVRSTMPGVPWGGVMRRAQALSAQYGAKGMPLDHLCVGHFHQANIVDQGRVVMNGSIKGVDEYSLKAFGGGGEPQQLLLSFHPKNGLTDVSYIDCV